MAGPNLLTHDDQPFWRIGDFTMEMMDMFNEADHGIVDAVSREVSTRTFLQRTGDFTWEEVAEMEHARTASLDDYQMAFGINTYAKDLGFSREYIEDTPAEEIREHVAEIVAGGEQKIFDTVFNVMTSGVADGSTLWFTPEDFGDYTFTNTHDHTWTALNNSGNTTTRVLFNDTASHTPSEIVRELQNDFKHHGYQADLALVPSEFANYFEEELTDGFGSQYFVPQAERLEQSTFPQNGLRTNGVNVMETAWLSPDTNGHYPIYLYDTSLAPVRTHTVRPMEITDNSGAPVGGAGGFRGDPGALLGTYGSMRMGAKFVNPLAGATVEAIDPASISTS